MSGQGKLKCVLDVINVLITTFVGQKNNVQNKVQNIFVPFLTLYFHCFMNCYEWIFFIILLFRLSWKAYHFFKMDFYIVTTYPVQCGKMPLYLRTLQRAFCELQWKKSDLLYKCFVHDQSHKFANFISDLEIEQNLYVQNIYYSIYAAVFLGL